ncbi:MAG: hypothetical protein ICV64_08335 [Thermoleophilia bacterium]|nr:hypothetical protein [Thermoleophilia bacterium]
MEPEGVVHALRNVHRMLAPGGLLLESHPLAGGSRVEVDGSTLGALDEREFARELAVMERSLATLVAEGAFAPQAERRFDVAMRFDTASELLAEVVTWRGSTVSARLQRAVKRAEGPFAVRLTTLLRVYASGSTRSPTRTRPASSTSP